jgi:predicted esterase
MNSEGSRLIGPLDLPPGHPGQRILSGRTPLVASQSDPRFSYCTYIPDSAPTTGAAVLVAVHGTGRDVHKTRERWVNWAEDHRCAVLAPLFPGAVDDPNDLSNYKTLSYQGIRFDEILLSMLDEAAQRWRLDVERFALYGYSGGGQFAHRFAYVHPERLSAVCVGAPGSTTLPFDPRPWPKGTEDMETVFGVPIRLDRLRSVPFRILVGELDTDASTMDPSTAPGDTRLAQANALTEALSGSGVPVDLEVIPGVAHDAGAFTESAASFFSQHFGAPMKSGRV